MLFACTVMLETMLQWNPWDSNYEKPLLKKVHSRFPEPKWSNSSTSVTLCSLGYGWHGNHTMTISSVVAMVTILHHWPQHSMVFKCLTEPCPPSITDTPWTCYSRSRRYWFLPSASWRQALIGVSWYTCLKWRLKLGSFTLSPPISPPTMQNMYKDVVSKYSSMKGQRITGLLPLVANRCIVYPVWKYPDIALFTMFLSW